MSTLKHTVNEIPNDWTNKERENFIFQRILTLPFMLNGDFLKKDKGIIKQIKKVYKSSEPENFSINSISELTNRDYQDKILVISEPFGSKSSPDFLFITNKGTFGIEDKSSKTHKITFNTGTPGGNKFFMYYDKKDKKVYLITGERWGWNQEVEKKFNKVIKVVKSFAKEEFEKVLGDSIKNMEFFARQMLIDKNKVKNIVHENEEDVIMFLLKFI